MFFSIFIAKNNNADRILFFKFWNVSNFYWKFYTFKINLFGNFLQPFLSAFVIHPELRPA